jgi:hypothetical protein
MLLLCDTSAYMYLLHANACTNNARGADISCEFRKFLDACLRTRVIASMRNRKATATLHNASVDSTDIVHSLCTFCTENTHYFETA